ncbi:MAG: hypothetical protein ACREC9_17040 [Methylocella sp.]
MPFQATVVPLTVEAARGDKIAQSRGLTVPFGNSVTAMPSPLVETLVVLAAAGTVWPSESSALWPAMKDRCVES